MAIIYWSRMESVRRFFADAKVLITCRVHVPDTRPPGIRGEHGAFPLRSFFGFALKAGASLRPPRDNGEVTETGADTVQMLFQERYRVSSALRVEGFLQEIAGIHILCALTPPPMSLPAPTASSPVLPASVSPGRVGSDISGRPAQKAACSRVWHSGTDCAEPGY